MSSTTPTTSSQLPAPRVITTTHTRSGVSIIESDIRAPKFQPFGPNTTTFSRFHSRLSVPVSNTSSPPSILAEKPTLPRCPPSGVLFSMSDILPQGRAPMHRTTSLDYAVVIEGRICLGLDGGEEVIVEKGEFIVQRGVNHSWFNPSETETCRIAFVMVGAEKIVLEDGTVLEETAFAGKK